MNISPYKVILTGLPGSGKSTLGRKLAQSLQWPFWDLDKKIEQQAGASVSQIFEQQGETAFRELEREVLLKTIEQPAPFVLATGGGAPAYSDNLEKMKAGGGILIWLDVPVELLAERLGGSRNRRPLIAGDDPLASLQKLMETRQPYYAQAHYRLQSTRLSKEDLLAVLQYHLDYAPR
jgi:shikimate kinase